MAGGPQAQGSTLWWIACDLSATTPTAQIISMPMTGGASAVWYQAVTPGAGISLLHVSDQWVMWVEHSDLRDAKDAKIFARPLAGGATVPIDDSTTHGTIASLEDTALNGAEAYWTEPIIDGAKWHGRLMHRHLPEGQPEVLVEAPLGSIIGWPAVAADTVAYEVTSQTTTPQTHVVIRIGAISRDVAGPSSEPAAGDGFVAFKSSERYDSGDLAVIRLADGSIMPLGPGEAPWARGAYVTWVASRPGGASLRVARPAAGCNDSIRDDSQSRLRFPSTDGQVLAWVYQDTDRPGADAIRVRYGSLLPKADAACGT